MNWDHQWATEDEIREQFEAEMAAKNLNQLPHWGDFSFWTQPVLAKAATLIGIPEREARSMTRAELVRTLDSCDPRD